MKKQISNVSVLQTAKVLAVLYFVCSIPFVAIMGISFMMTGQGGGMPMFMLVLFPVLYLVLGFIFTVIGAWIYNLVAGMVGGIEFTTSEVVAK